MGTLDVPKAPCSSCPYRRDHPSGVWSHAEYEKLKGYATNERTGTFLCHQTNATGRQAVCRGWLTVEAESAGARLAVVFGEVEDEDRYEDVMFELHPTGMAAALAGQARIDDPPPEARAMAQRLVNRGAALRYEGDDDADVQDR